MALNGYSEKEPFKGDGADVPTSTVVSQRSSGADSRHSRFSVKPVGSSANTFEPASGSLSIVISTLNAEDEIHGCLSSSLFVPTAKGLIKEVIVSDGGSTDQTKLIAESMGAHWIDTPIGRGAQLAAGAEAAVAARRYLADGSMGCGCDEARYEFAGECRRVSTCLSV